MAPSGALPELPGPSACLAFHQAVPFLPPRVDERLLRHPDLIRFLGPNAYDLLRQNHENHAKFMDNVFFLGAPALLRRTLPWVYRTYGARGVSPDYFPVELEAWKGAVAERLPGAEAEAIHRVYDWMIEIHPAIVQEAKEGPVDPAPDAGPLLEPFVLALVTGDRVGSEAIATQALGAEGALETLYLDLLDPALRRIGNLWEAGRITTAQEHMASALATRLMAQAFARLDYGARPGRRALVAASPNEHHQIGAWMLSDLLEVRGWNTRFMGADTPQEALLDAVRAFRPHLVALSVTMAFNLRRTAELIQAVRGLDLAPAPRILVGGQIFQWEPGLAESLGADGGASDARSGCLMAESWVEGRP